MMKTKLGQWVAALLAVLMMCDFWLYMPGNKVYADSQADALVSVALAEEGYTEGANNYSKYGEWYYNNVSKEIDYAHADWCAMFISWCARQAGIPTSIIKNNAWAGSMSSSKRTGNFGGQYYPKGSITPQKGDIAYYGWGSSSSVHVEIVISTSGNTFTSIGGNTGGGTQVYIHRNYSFTSSDIVGFERPNYDGSTVTPPANDDELGIGYPRPSGNPLLSTGSTGSGVSWLQTALNKANNAGLAVDGDFGSGTKQAVINFQNAYGLEADGIAGPATIQKLVEVIKSSIKPILDAPNLNIDVCGQDVTFSWNLVDNATGYDLRIYNSDGTSYADYWDFTSNENSLTIIMPENTEFFAAVCSKNSNYEECWSYSQQFSFKTGIHKHDFTTKIIPPTCRLPGYTLHECNSCGYSYRDHETRALGHSYEAEKVIEPTFAEEGYTVYVCSKCKDSYKGNFIKKVQGDLNADNKLTISDAVLLQKWLLAIPNTTLTDWQAGDMNGNGTLNGIDLCLMKQALLAKSPS